MPDPSPVASASPAKAAGSAPVGPASHSFTPSSPALNRRQRAAAFWIPDEKPQPSPEPLTPETRFPSSLRLNWQLKALLPVAAVLLNGLLLFILATVSLDYPQRNAVLVVATVGAIVICTVLVAALSIVVRRPMSELQDKIDRVSDGDLTARVEFATRNDEIGDLGRKFNAMVGQLRENRDEIQRLYRTQMSRAEHLATLGELAAGLAHEIRNPLAGIAGVVEIIARDLPENSPAREVVADVRQEIAHIDRIVTDLLETARPKAPDFRLADINSTLEHAVIFARQQALSQPIKVELRKAAGIALVEHDANQIHQVLLNLLLNAIQAIDGPGTVRAEVEPRQDSVAITITDTGKGIPPETLPNIFRPFFTTKGNGTGLGLSLARRIVEDHAGAIEVTSRVGEGACFTVVLPLRKPAEPA